jgi:hypothetical protein
MLNKIQSRILKKISEILKSDKNVDSKYIGELIDLTVVSIDLENVEQEVNEL